jgi:methionyl aminopeptidase
VDLVKTKQEITAMREGGRILAHVLGITCESIKPGKTTKEVADTAKKELKKFDAEPAFYNYSGFPDVICISVNNEVVHGVPGGKVIADGDIISLDFGVRYKNLVTDAARTVLIGQDNMGKQKLIETTKKSFEAGFNEVKDGAYVGDIGAAVQKVLESSGFGVVRTLTGHGVGRKVHEPPNIPNYGRRGTGMKLKAGMTLAIEPMSTQGSCDVYTAADGWTVITKDNSLSAHHENTIVVTKTGAQIITCI